MNDGTEEVVYTSDTGGQKGQKSARLGGADPLALEQLAFVYGFGETKYSRFNYLKGYPWSLSIDALYRHFLAFQAGEDVDPESGRPHMAHAAWHALTLVSFMLRELGEDDRAPLRGAPAYGVGSDTPQQRAPEGDQPGPSEPRPELRYSDRARRHVNEVHAAAFWRELGFDDIGVAAVGSQGNVRPLWRRLLAQAAVARRLLLRSLP